MYSYVVKGSEDGTLGVYTNRKKAKQCAADYLADELREGDRVEFDENEHVIYANIVDVHGDTRYRIEAEIERFVTNK